MARSARLMLYCSISTIMPSISLSNDPPPLSETISTWTIIAGIERAIENTEKRTCIELVRLDHHRSEVAILEQTLQKAQKAVEVRRGHIAHLNSTADTIKSFSMKQRWDNVAFGRQVQNVLEEFESCYAGLSSLTLDAIWMDINMAKEEEKELLKCVENLSEELLRRKSICLESEATLKTLRRVQIDSELRLDELKRTLRTFRRIPEEIWVPIFELCIEAEYKDFIKKNKNNPMESTPFMLSQVCRFWRRIILRTPRLWKITAIHPSEWWSRSKMSHFHDCLLWSNRETTLIANLSQKLTWSPPSIWSPTVKPLPLEDRTYNLHLDMKAWSSNLMKNVSVLPYRRPKALYISSRTAATSVSPHPLLDIFTSVESLTFLREYPAYIPATNLSVALPKLITLSFEVRGFPLGFTFAPFLSPNLRELHIQYSNGDCPPRLPRSLKLPKLQILGLTFPAFNILDILDAPALITVVLYRPLELKDMGEMKPMHRVQTIEFVNWNYRLTHGESLEKSFEWASLCAQVARCTPNLRCVKFKGGVVDGDSLLMLAKGRADRIGGELYGKLQEITLSRTRGTTQEHCMVLANFIAKLNIYV